MPRRRILRPEVLVVILLHNIHVQLDESFAIWRHSPEPCGSLDGFAAGNAPSGVEGVGECWLLRALGRHEAAPRQRPRSRPGTLSQNIAAAVLGQNVAQNTLWVVMGYFGLTHSGVWS